MLKHSFIAGVIGLMLLTAWPVKAAAPLSSRVNEAFQTVYGHLPSSAENTYWLGRVTRGDKKTFEALLGAMYYQKAHATTAGLTTVGTSTKQQLIIDVLPMFVNIYHSNPSEAEKAWWRKRIACNELSTEQAVSNAMRYHQSKGARKGSDTICGQKVATGTAVVSKAIAVIRRGVAGISHHVMGDEVRIGIFATDGRAIHLTSDGKYQIREGQSKILKTVNPRVVVQVSWSDGKYHVRGSGISFDTTNEIRLVPLNQAIMQIKSYSDPSPTIPGKNYNRFRGIIEIRKCDGCRELWAINELRTEYYLRGLAETSGNGPAEYIKALGIAARTYVLYHKVVTGGRFPKQHFDIGRTADDQVYRGYEYEAITPRMASIFNQTKGIIVTSKEGDAPVVTTFFSDSDGRTRSAQEQWHSSRFPHLQSVKDPYHVAKQCNGHCVGLSAQGAYGFASKKGWSYQKILSYFYQGISLVKAY